MSREFELIFQRANDEDAQFRLCNQLDDDGTLEVQRPRITGMTERATPLAWPYTDT